MFLWFEVSVWRVVTKLGEKIYRFLFHPSYNNDQVSWVTFPILFYVNLCVFSLF